MHRAAAAVGHAPDRAPAAQPARPRVPLRAGAPRLDTHPAQRAAAAVPAGMTSWFVLRHNFS